MTPSVLIFPADEKPSDVASETSELANLMSLLSDSELIDPKVRRLITVIIKWTNDFVEYSEKWDETVLKAEVRKSWQL